MSPWNACDVPDGTKGSPLPTANGQSAKILTLKPDHFSRVTSTISSPNDDPGYRISGKGRSLVLLLADQMPKLRRTSFCSTSDMPNALSDRGTLSLMRHNPTKTESNFSLATLASAALRALHHRPAGILDPFRPRSGIQG